ncbi:MAG: primosomal protein N' [Candidatus Portnoybacteria bacterium]|nr:primosomal protein N' [Candidatus Portnoybacteria bacterium]
MPQILSYFSAHSLAVGSLISAPLGKRNEEAVVVESREAEDMKLEIKKAEFELKPVKKIIKQDPILTENQIKLAIWLAEYYFTSPGLFLKMALPKIAPSKWSTASTPKPKEQKLILMPTIGQINPAAKAHSKKNSALVYSALKSKKLNENWRKIADGEAEIIIGTRMAVFAPFANLKEITVKNESNSGHRSWDMFPRWRTHEAAQKLGDLYGAKVSFENDAPSVEFDISAFLSGPKPKIIDLREEMRKENYSIFSLYLQEAMQNALENKKQIILFINRRGTSTFVLCRDCGYVALCENCEAPLALHQFKTKNGLKPVLLCHHCGRQTTPPGICPKCQGSRIKGFGSGTQKIEAEAKKFFPHARILRLDGDIAPKAAIAKKIVKRFNEKKADILIGTQMLLDGNSNKAELTAMISADTLMHLPDFRSDERLAQIIFRLQKLTKNDFIIQTYNPENSVLKSISENNFEKFIKTEIETRKILKYPPFSQLIKLTLRQKDPRRAADEAKILFAKLTQPLKTSKIFNDAILELIGPAPAFISKEKGRYIWRIILKAKPVWPAENQEEIISIRNRFLSMIPSNWEIEVDPENLL